MSCKDLENINLLDGLETIGLYAFSKSGLESITMPKSVRTIHQGAFYKCASLKHVVLNKGLEMLGTDEYLDNEMYPGVFEESSVEYTELPSTLKQIEYNTFKACKNLKSVQLPNKLETIGLYAFSESELENIKMPKSIKTICQGAFFACKSLRKATLNEGLESLGTD